MKGEKKRQKQTGNESLRNRNVARARQDSGEREGGRKRSGGGGGGEKGRSDGVRGAGLLAFLQFDS